METDLQVAIERRKVTLFDGARADDVQLSGGTVAKLLRWFPGNPYSRDPEAVSLALSVLAWCDELSGLAPNRALQDASLQWASVQFNVPRGKLLDLADASRALLRLDNACQWTIAFEGIDGAGKSKQMELLRRSLAYQEGRRVHTLSFPRYDCFFGREVADRLMGRHALGADRLDSKSMALWYALDRWRAFQDRGTDTSDFLLLDRFTLSSAVYQSLRTPGSEDALVDWILTLEHVELAIPVPDIYIILDINPEIAQANILNKGFRQYSGSTSDVYERSSELLTRARDQYLRLAQMFEGIQVIDCMQSPRVMKTPEAIHEQVLRCLEQCHIVGIIQ
jgi:dTMP kinase